LLGQKDNMLTIQQSHDIVLEFLLTPAMKILDKFAATNPIHIYTKSKQEVFSSLFIPGTRPDRVLLIAHVDTIPNDSPKLKIEFGGENALFYSGTRRTGFFKSGKPFANGLPIGADDRAGCAILWELKDLGHSLLLVHGEEFGCLGSRYLMSNPKMAALMQNHQFAIEFDRHGEDDLVFYHVATKKFAEYCLKKCHLIRWLKELGQIYAAFAEIYVVLILVWGIMGNTL
jgi:hypothetical protein